MPDTHIMPVAEDKPGRIKIFRRKLEVWYPQVKRYVISHKSGRLLSLQIAGAFSVLLGIAQYSVPIALITGGVGAILAAERQS